MKITKGSFGPYGAWVRGNQVTFTFARNSAKPAAIVLFDSAARQEIETINVPEEFILGNVCSVTVDGIDTSKTCYLLSVDGNLAMDPYAAKVVGRDKWNDTDRVENDFRVYSGFVKDDYKWKHEGFLKIAPDDLVIYKLHMRGFSMQHGVSASAKGNVKGLLNKVKEIRDMGFTAIELMPIYDFEEVGTTKTLGIDASGLSVVNLEPTFKVNYWGYGDASYLAPKASYFPGKDPARKAKDMVDTIHGLGMEVYMEVSFAAGVSQDLMVDTLVNWVRRYHIDGFHLVGLGLPIKRIVENPYLAQTKLFYDGFDQELLDGQKNNKHLFVYNDDFQYSLRKLQNHLDGSMPEFANQLKRQNSEYGFVNYAANSNGFTLYDAYAYGEKHNEANGEDNRDGNNFNYSHNYGVEGKTTSSAVNDIRSTHIRTAIAAVMLAQGVPLLQCGDEVMNSQEGNNNPYCQDNSIGWVQYFQGKQQKQLQEFTKKLIAFRKEHRILSMEDPYQMSDYKHLGLPDLSYHGREPWIMYLGQEKRALGILFCGEYAGEEEDILLCYNFHYDWEDFALPEILGKKWYFWGNTKDVAVQDSKLPQFENPALAEDQRSIVVSGGSVSILIAKPTDKPEEVKLAKDEEQITDIEDADSEIINKTETEQEEPAAINVSEKGMKKTDSHQAQEASSRKRKSTKKSEAAS